MTLLRLDLGEGHRRLGKSVGKRRYVLVLYETTSTGLSLCAVLEHDKQDHVKQDHVKRCCKRPRQTGNAKYSEKNIEVEEVPPCRGREMQCPLEVRCLHLSSAEERGHMMSEG